MKLISHRGNTNGPLIPQENKPSYIESALSEGYDVEIDVWKIGSNWFLGHDYHQHPTSISFLRNDHLLCHAKNLEALDCMLNDEIGIHCFWHQEDSYTITSKGLIVSYPSYAVTASTICMKPELLSIGAISEAYGLCSDYIDTFSKMLRTPPS